MRKGITSVLFAFLVLFLAGWNVEAAQGGNIEANVLLDVTQEANVYEEMDTNSAIKTTLSPGTPIFSKEASQGEWILINYQDVTGYVQIENVCIYGDEELDAEFEQIASLNELLINELEYIDLQKRQKTTWTLIIVALVIAIFVVTIVSAVMKNVHKIEKKEKTGKKRRKPTTVYKHQKHGQ